MPASEKVPATLLTVANMDIAPSTATETLFAIATMAILAHHVKP
jgi:hypothetical protein